MLKHNEIAAVAADFGAECAKRDYVHRILAPGFSEEPEAWEMILEVMEVVLHRRGLYIVPQALVSGVLGGE